MAGNGRWKSLFQRKSPKGSEDGPDVTPSGIPKWSMGVLNDEKTIEVPGSVLLLASDHNEPLGLQHAPARTSQSSFPTSYSSRPGTPRQSTSSRPAAPVERTPVLKKTDNGEIILNPQPEDSANDPLNWPTWRRDAALLSLGFYCMVGGGITPLLAAGFPDVSRDYDVEVETVALTTGLYMLGLALGSVVWSPTAILYGKRPVYLVSAVIWILTCVWCALSPSFPSLVVARIFQGIAVSPVECLPSATIAEIFFLHERAFRIGIYTLLLLGGKNLIPLISALIIQSLNWRWVFWIIAFIVAFGGVMLFFFVPETFWDRTPAPKPRGPSARPSFMRRISSRYGDHHHEPSAHPPVVLEPTAESEPPTESSAPPAGTVEKSSGAGDSNEVKGDKSEPGPRHPRVGFALEDGQTDDDLSAGHSHEQQPGSDEHPVPEQSSPAAAGPVQPTAPVQDQEKLAAMKRDAEKDTSAPASVDTGVVIDPASRYTAQSSEEKAVPYQPEGGHTYTTALRYQPARTFVQQLRPYHGRLCSDNWFKVMLRPFVLFAYPGILWSAAVYSCSVGWLIVISESMALIYQNPDSYNFNALQTGLVYLSPFVGGLLGTAVAGKVSDIIVKAMSRRNGGLYEPEFRLVMAAPILVTTVLGLMGFGWSAEKGDHWIVPTVFFGIISFGCSLGSTTSITFCVDSYRQYAGEALVTLNFSKNFFHGLIFSLFFTHWMSDDGPKMVFIWTGIIQLILMLTTIPLYIYGKRARMWTVRKNLVEKLGKR
ncbi:related to HOL1 protein [Cephalotrichum gorgonifer]|uniref:Related to HOL1 protein n=1 Tax=Cephalotrichum gorgonifer TaxID=2041049 RepID=A0AAE8MSR0_9PEZI|nr:related to HOL1 protein [Cephalotrichum gorgonifer]